MQEHLLTILTQFTGGINPEDHFVRLGLAAIFWLMLIWQANDLHPHKTGIKRMLITGFALGFLCEALMFIVFFLRFTGLVANDALYPYQPPLEHLLTGVSQVWIIAAFLAYLLNSKLGRRYLAAGLTTTGIMFVITFPDWFTFSSGHPAAHFDQMWYDWAWHVNGVLLTGFAIIMTLRIPGWPRFVLCAAISCFFLDDAMLLFNLSSCETFRPVYDPIRHALHITAIPLFGYIFMREQRERQELHEAELHHSKRELRSFVDALELRVVERTVELEVTAMRLQQAEELAHMGHWSYVKDSDHFFCSEEVLNIFELPCDESGISLTRLKTYYQPEDQDAMEHMFGALLEHGTAYDVTRTITLPDGRVKHVHIKCRPGGTPDVDAVGTLQDVTQQVTLEYAMWERELELIAARRVAESANIAKSAFLATMSHEIRTPLNAMTGNLTLLEMTLLTEQQQKYIRDCSSASQMLLRVINDILDFSKIEAGKMELVNEGYSPLTMLDSLVSIFACRAEEKQLRLTLKVIGQLPDAILGDRHRFSQIISNLLSNAIKFTLQGEVTLSASIITSGQGAKLLAVSVGDSGIGIPPEQQSAIFDSFTQLDNFSTRRHGGTGLGLAISKRLVEMMGGEITLSSSPGAGSTFTVTTPVTLCAAPETAKQAKTIKGITRKILLADDDTFGREIATAMLERKGHRITAVEDGAAVMEALQNNQFDVLITDISMPDMDGTQVANIIRSGEQEGIDLKIPIIAMTAHAFPQDRERFLDSGINGYISKPVNFNELLGLIEEVCGTGTDVQKVLDSGCSHVAAEDIGIPLFSEE